MDSLPYFVQSGYATSAKVKPSTNDSQYLNVLFLIADLVLLNACSYVAFYIVFDGATFDLSKLALFVVAYNLLWVVASMVTGLYRIDRSIKINATVFKTLVVLVLHLLIVNLFSQIYYDIEIVKQLIFSYFLLVMILPASKGVMLRALLYYRTRGFNTKEFVIVGTNSIANKIFNLIEENPALGYRYKGFFEDSQQADETLPNYKGNLEELFNFCQANRVDEIFCALSMENSQEIAKVLEFADNHLIRFRFIPDFGTLNNRMGISFFEHVPVLTPRYEPLENTFNRIAKRAFDIVFSLGVISFIFPIMLPIIALLIKLTSKGPVFFRQLRTGKDNKSFYCYKFRTMTVNKDSDKVQAKKGDARITWIGNILRKTSLDEFPQFFNVLEGNMSVVGPRPHMLLHTEEYSKIINKFMVRHFVKPGITGWAQVKGFRGNTENSEMMEKRIEHDTWYVENWSFWLDLKIIFLTVWNIVQGEENAF